MDLVTNGKGSYGCASGLSPGRPLCASGPWLPVLGLLGSLERNHIFYMFVGLEICRRLLIMEECRRTDKKHLHSCLHGFITFDSAACAFVSLSIMQTSTRDAGNHNPSVNIFNHV